MATRCARAMLSSRRWEMMTEKRKNMIRKTPPASRKSVSGESGNPMRLRTALSSGCARERISMAAAASSQLTEYSDLKDAAGEQEKRQWGIRQSDEVAHRVEQRVRAGENQHGGGGQQPAHRILHSNVRPAHADQDHDEQDHAQSGGDVQEAVHLSSSAALALRAMIAAIEFQYVDKNSEQHVDDGVERFEGRNGRAAGGARAHRAGHLFETETAALQHHEGFNLGVFQRETLAEHVQRALVDAHEAGGGIVHLLAQNRPQHQAKKADSERADGPRPRTIAGHEARADHHLATRGLELLEDAGNVAGIVLPIAI